MRDVTDGQNAPIVVYWLRNGLTIIGKLVEPTVQGIPDYVTLLHPAATNVNGALMPYPMAVEQLVDKDSLRDHTVHLDEKDIVSQYQLREAVKNMYERFATEVYLGLAVPNGNVIDIGSKKG